MYKKIFFILALSTVMFAHGAKAECACSKNRGITVSSSQDYDGSFAYDPGMLTKLPTQ
jgi:hypothetical protein